MNIFIKLSEFVESWFFSSNSSALLTFQENCSLGPHSQSVLISSFNTSRPCEGWQLCFSENRPHRIKKVATIVKKLPHFAPKQITLNTRAESQLAISVMGACAETWRLKTKRCFVLLIFTLHFYRQEYVPKNYDISSAVKNLLYHLPFLLDFTKLKPKKYNCRKSPIQKIL